MKSGDEVPATYEREGVLAIRDFISTLCSHNKDATHFLLDWISQMVLSPERKPYNAISLVGPGGCGKTTLLKLIGILIGEERVLTSCMPESDIWGKRNHHMADALLVHLPEFSEISEARMYRLKSFISDQTIGVNTRSGMYRQRSKHRLLITGHVTFVGSDDLRRIFQITSNGEMIGDTARFKRLYQLFNQPRIMRSFRAFIASPMRTFEPLLVEASLINTDSSPAEVDLRSMAKLLNQSNNTLAHEIISSALLGSWAVQQTQHALTSDLARLVAAAVIKAMLAEAALAALSGPAGPSGAKW